MRRFYLATLSDPPKRATVSRKASRAVELEANWRTGILPKVGGWDDQDPDDIIQIRLASQMRGERLMINKQIADRKRKK